jgi:fructose-1,6-bisphosphatase
VYSSSTELVLSFRDKVVGFTLVDEDDDENTDNAGSVFRLTCQSIVCPNHRLYYSLNEAREPDWPAGLQRWIYDAKRCQTPSHRTYSFTVRLFVMR